MIVLPDGPDNAAEHHLHGKWAFLLCGPPLQSICLWSCTELTFSSECQKSSESPCSPECLSHPAALQFSQDLHFSLTGLTDIHLFFFYCCAACWHSWHMRKIQLSSPGIEKKVMWVLMPMEGLTVIWWYEMQYKNAHLLLCYMMELNTN